MVVQIIINDITKEFYIGSSTNINTRLSHHFSNLKKNINVCERLQESYNKYSHDDFSFYILYKSEDEKFIRDKELELLEDNYDNPLLLNTSTKHDNWINDRNKNKVIKYKEKLSVIAHNRTGNKNPFYGRHHSEETKKKLSDQRKNKGYIPSNARKVLIDGIEYNSVAEAARKLKVTGGTIIHRIKSPNKKYINYTYVS